MNKMLRVLVIVCTIFIFLSGCSFLAGDKKTESTAQTVGPEGSELSSNSGDFKVIIPKGTLKNKTEISIAQYTNEKPLGKDQASAFFEISGLNEISAPVTVQFKTNQPLSGETYIALGTRSYVKSLNEETSCYTYLPCDIKDGTVEFVLEPFENASGNAGNEAKISLFDKLLRPLVVYAQDSGSEPVFLSAAVITNQRTSQLKNGRYKIISSVDISETQIDLLTTYLEYCETFYARMGHDLNKYKKWPLELYITKKDAEDKKEEDKKPQAVFVQSRWTDAVWIEMPEDMLQNKKFNDMRASLIHEYFHFIQTCLYKSKNLWFDEATAVWSEEFYEKDSAYISAVYQTFGESNLQVLDGPANHSKRSTESHGYGSWAFIKYLAPDASQGSQFVKIYKKINNYKSEIDILNDIRPVNTWIGDFYTKLYTGELHPKTQTGPGRLRMEAPKVTIDLDKPDNGITHDIEVPGLGVRVVMLELKANEKDKVPEHAKLTANANNNQCIISLVRNQPLNNRYAVLNSNTGKASATMVKELLGDRWPQQVSVLVINTSTEPTKFTLDLKVELSDLWEYTNLKAVTGSAVLNWGSNSRSDLRNMFGYSATPGPEPSVTLFVDYLPAGTLHWVEWETIEPVTIKSFRLTASHDHGPAPDDDPERERDANYRGFSSFTLKYWDDGTNGWVTLYETSPGNPYGQGNNRNYLVIEENVNEITSGRFRAEFIQYGDKLVTASGPRVIELDGYGTPLH